MRLDPAIAALQRDRALQRRAQAATAAAWDSWRSTPEARAALAEFGRYGEGAPLLSCPARHSARTSVAMRPAADSRSVNSASSAGHDSSGAPSP